MMIKKISSCFLIALALQFTFTHCIKKKKNVPADIHCDQSQMCVGNLTNDTIFFDWNSNTTNDTLLPGEIICMETGPMTITYDKKTGEEKTHTTYVHMINSTAGSWFIEVAKCYKRSNFEYDIDDPSSGLIRLYAEE